MRAAMIEASSIALAGFETRRRPMIVNGLIGTWTIAAR
jgi:hypothetical protein